MLIVTTLGRIETRATPITQGPFLGQNAELLHKPSMGRFLTIWNTYFREQHLVDLANQVEAIVVQARETDDQATKRTVPECL